MIVMECSSPHTSEAKIASSFGYSVFRLAMVMSLIAFAIIVVDAIVTGSLHVT